MVVLLALALVSGCRRHRARGHATRAPAAAEAGTPDTATDGPGSPDGAGDGALDGPLDDRCKRHDDCVKVDLYVDGPLRCCLACGSQAAASKAAADAFIAVCAAGKEMRECPIYDCVAPPSDAVCVAGRCMLRPRP